MPETPQVPQSPFWRRWGWVIAGLAIAVTVVVFLAPAASDDPDGLERVAADRQFEDSADDPAFEWLTDYAIPGIENETVSVVLAGLAGLAVVFVLTYGFGALMRASRRDRAEP